MQELRIQALLELLSSSSEEQSPSDELKGNTQIGIDPKQICSALNLSEKELNVCLNHLETDEAVVFVFESLIYCT